MNRSDSLHSLPNDLPIPEDDGACAHLRGASLPSLPLRSTSGRLVDLSKDGNPWLVVYCYPRTGRPNEEPPGGINAWNAIPGARGCTPQSCSYRDHYRQLSELGATVYGLSTQNIDYQAEAVQRLHLPFSLLSDSDLKFAHTLKLPTFTHGGSALIKRLTLIAGAGRIEQVFYPVYPPDSDADNAIAWLVSHATASG